MGVSGPYEIWILIGGLCIIFIGIIFKLLLTMNIKRSIFNHWKLIILFGFLTCVSSFLVAVGLGRSSAFFTSVTSSPIGLIKELFSSQVPSYTQSCINNTCTKYCCTDAVYSHIKWKDCNKFCTSYEGHFGKNTGDDCLGDANLDSFCSVNNIGTGNSSVSLKGCNVDPLKGPITCSCCVDTNNNHWWDCENTCSSNGIVNGTLMPMSSCNNIIEYKCIETIDDKKDDNISNSQNF